MIGWSFRDISKIRGRLATTFANSTSVESEFSVGEGLFSIFAYESIAGMRFSSEAAQTAVSHAARISN
jgi:hypothetical protein